jgi:hypothetical protein
MFFTVAVDMADGGFFEYSTESILKFLQTVRMLGNPDIEEVEIDDESFDIPEDIEQYFVEGEEYIYDEDAEVYCWYDEEHEAWYWLNIETGDWLLVEDEDYEVEAESEDKAV